MDINIFSKEIAFGITPFETIYFENKTLHFLYEHFIRLKRACRALKVLFSHDFDKFRSNIEYYLQSQDASAGVLKTVVLNGKLHFNIRQPGYLREKYEEGHKLLISKAVRDENNILNYFKTFNYGINYIEDNRAKNKGCDSAVFLNSKKQICETAYGNIFFREGKTLYTPKLNCGILKGIMREQVIKYARSNDFDVIKRCIAVEDLSHFNECFITNSVAGVFPVKSIENHYFKERQFCNLINREEPFTRSWNFK